MSFEVLLDGAIPSFIGSLISVLAAYGLTCWQIKKDKEKQLTKEKEDKKEETRNLLYKFAYLVNTFPFYFGEQSRLKLINIPIEKRKNLDPLEIDGLRKDLSIVQADLQGYHKRVNDCIADIVSHLLYFRESSSYKDLFTNFDLLNASLNDLIRSVTVERFCSEGMKYSQDLKREIVEIMLKCIEELGDNNVYLSSDELLAVCGSLQAFSEFDNCSIKIFTHLLKSSPNTFQELIPGLFNDLSDGDTGKIKKLTIPKSFEVRDFNADPETMKKNKFRNMAKCWALHHDSINLPPCYRKTEKSYQKHIEVAYPQWK